MLKHVSGVISDESKRLRFLVERVLQMSMFDRKNAVFKKKELDLNEMLENAAHSFQLRVEHTGGKIDVDIEAIDSAIYVDEVHFTNMIFNLMDNAIKYRKPDKPLKVDQSKCIQCKRCIREIGCPGIVITDGKVQIDDSLCTGCSLCSQICPPGAIGR